MKFLGSKLLLTVLSFGLSGGVAATAHGGNLDIETALPDEARAAFAELLNEEGGAGGFGTDDKTISNPRDFPGDQWIPRMGPEVEMLRLIEVDADGAAAPVKKYWVQLSRDQFLQQLNSQYSETLLFRKDSGGGLTFAGAFSAGANAKKGAYQLVYNNFRYKTYPCSEAEPNAGELAVGVGLRIVVDAVFKSGSFNIGFGPIALSASQEKVAGVIRSEVKGLANSITLSGMASDLASASVSYDSLIKASNLNSVAGQALESIMAPTTPFIMGYKDGALPGSCLAAMRAAAQQ